MFQLGAVEKGLHLKFDRLPGTPRYIRVDEVKLRQVLINLLNNGLKFTGQGSVTMRVSGDTGQASGEPLSATPDVQATGPVILHFEVEDTGPGIASTELENLFKAFTQTKAGQQVQEGTGLGLTISQKFVQLMWGEISLASNVGQGTTFQFDLPVELVPAIELDEHFDPAHRAVGLEPHQSVYRLLVVDDNGDNRHLLLSILEPLGFELKEAEHGAEAVEIWVKWQPHLIWMDIRMPVMDGREAARRIKATDRAGDHRGAAPAFGGQVCV